MRFELLSLVLALSRIVAAQFPPFAHYDHVLTSPINPAITISYRTPDPGTCTTIYDTQQQYTGYISLPPFSVPALQQNYSINTFFWFIEARRNPQTAPLTVWLNGGPGSSSMIGLFTENGPCEVVQLADGSYGTQARMWGWDRSSNMLFIDQPVQTGFSYDVLKNASRDLFRSKFIEPPALLPEGMPPWAFLNGTFSSQEAYAMPNTTELAASAVWHFLQGFLAAFPQYNPGLLPNSSTTLPTGINLFTESYGGIYGPAFATLFEEQNALRLNGTIDANATLDIRLTSVGILNGLVDYKLQLPFYPKFANNNTYGIQAIDLTTSLNALSDFHSTGGCQDMISQCRTLMQWADPEGNGDVRYVNNACSTAQSKCLATENVYGPSGRSYYDIRQMDPSPFPSSAYIEYLNTEAVQKSIGVPVNYTDSSDAIYSAFASTGDILRATQLADVATLLDMGIRVSFLYGDADYIANWMGGEAVSLAVASILPAYVDHFPASGYADIVVNKSYVGGVVRQYGNLSFARIYDSGHLIPAYQPETAFTVFTRIVQGTALATGEMVNLSTYHTSGPAVSGKSNKAGQSQKPVCWIRAIGMTCSSLQAEALKAGKGVVHAGVWYASEGDYERPSTSVRAGKPGSVISTSSTATATGVYVATGTPTSSGGRGKSRSEWGTVLLLAGVLAGLA
ncbi:alpha/beta-hydrolase [Trichodelitschia bisporula]|uniref:Carboxypeptidase n=1 Tax=Trichodelitschia bisporula TaxID=703511 RepID=A0A6G1HYA2_9PEZI|nr:alpha/beta-hydrolase [Trichodelitschia bisporula]